MSRRGYAAAFPTPAELTRETDGIRRVLARSGVPPADRPDLVQDVLWAAWLQIRQGEYRPDPEAKPRVALRSWVQRIAYFTATRYRRRARVRREFPGGLDPGPLQQEELLARLEARSDLAAFRLLGDLDQGVLFALLSGATVKAYAAAEGLSESEAWRWLDEARRAFAALLAAEEGGAT